MKRFFHFGKASLIVALLFSFNQSCTDLDEQLYDTVDVDNFFKSEEEFIAALGSAYTSLYGMMNHGGYFSLQEVSSDEIMIPQRGGDWGDGGQWLNAHRHELKASDPNVNGAWGFLFGGVTTCNRLIFQFNDLVAKGKADPALAGKFVAELRLLRALYYFYLLDTFGNVPLVTDFADTKLPSQATRKQVYDFIEKECKEAGLLVDRTVGGPAYGRMNFFVSQAILHKLYLNAEVYTGTAKWQEALNAADSIVLSGKYRPEANYRTNFVTNNEGSGEFILAIPYDKVFAQGFNLAQMTLHYASQATFELQDQPWNGYCSLQDFYESYSPGDTRQRINHLAGPQFRSDGITPVKDPAAESRDSLDAAGQKVKDADGNVIKIFLDGGEELVFTPEINQHFPGAFRQAGVRIGKFEFAKKATPNLSNDMPLFRYSDIMLGKAECHLRLNKDVEAARGLVNILRRRAGAPEFTSANFNLANLLKERGHEMFYEGWRRQDLIRFGQFGTPTDWMPGSDKNKELFPIPASQLNANSNLKQNPGY